MTTEPTPSQPKPKPAPKPRSAQDRKIAKDLALTEQRIKAALADTEAAPLLAEGGYDEAAFTNLLSLQQTTFLAYVARAETDGAQAAATNAYNTANKAAHRMYTQLRGFAKSAYMKDPDGRQLLGLSGSEPRNQQEFLTAAEALVTEGLKEPHATKLARKGVTAARLTAFKAKRDAMVDADRIQNAAIKAVPRATADRDTKMKELADAMNEYLQFARTQFKDRPDILGRLLL